MYQIQDHSKSVFQPQDLILWHEHTKNRVLPIPGVVVRQREEDVTIRICVEGRVREMNVSPDELIER